MNDELNGIWSGEKLAFIPLTELDLIEILGCVTLNRCLTVVTGSDDVGGGGGSIPSNDGDGNDDS